MDKRNADQLRKLPVDDELRKTIKKNPVYIILDNVLDTYNIGAIFRLAEAVAAEEVIICGESETPPNSRIRKASINTTEWVKWSYAETTAQAIQDLRSRIKDIKIYAIEQDERSVPYDSVDYSFPVALIVGHETTGVAKEVLDMVDEIVEIPMWGINISLNVMVSLGIVLFAVMRHVPFQEKTSSVR